MMINTVYNEDGEFVREEPFDADVELDKLYPTEQTNEEWIKSANTEQLAEVLNKIFMTRTFCHICPEGGVCDIGYECKYHGGNIKDFLEWLKQPHTNE